MVMTTISAETSIMDILEGGASAKFFGLLEESNDLNRQQLDRQKSVEDEMASMSDAVVAFQDGIKTTFTQTANNLRDGITNPINKMREESITAYTNFTESMHELQDGVSQKLTDVKEGFSTKVDGLKTSLTDAVVSTKDVMEGMSVKMEAFKNLPTEQQVLLAGKAIADGVMVTISTLPDIISSGMDQLDKGLSTVGGFMETSSGYLKGLFQNSEENDDVGGTSGLSGSDSKLTDVAGGAGIGSMIGKMLPKGIFKGLAKFGKTVGKFGKLAGKIALPLAVLLGIFDFVDGIQNAEEIVGKPKEQLSSMEKAGAGLSSVLSGLTFGLVSSKDIFAFGKKAVDTVSGFAEDMFNSLPDGVQGVLTEIGDFLFSSDGGIFAGIGDLFSSSIEAIAEGDWLALAINITTAPMKLLFGSNGILANTFNGIMESLPNSFQESITEFADTIMGWFEEIKNMASDLIPDSLKNFFGDISESETGKAVSTGLSATKSFFGYGDDSEVVKNVKSSDAVIRANKANPEPTISENKAGIKSITKQREKTITTKAKAIKDSDTATKKSKIVMNRQQDVAPVIIQAPAPVQKQTGSGKQLNTSTSIGDTELAVMNSNMMD